MILCNIYFVGRHSFLHYVSIQFAKMAVNIALLYAHHQIILHMCHLVLMLHYAAIDLPTAGLRNDWNLRCRRIVYIFDLVYQGVQLVDIRVGGVVSTFLFLEHVLALSEVRDDNTV